MENNILVANLRKYSNRFKMIREKAAHEGVLGICKALNVKTPSLKAKIMNLSGGNQQKVLLGRWLLTNSNVLILDEPTRGIDVGAKFEIYKIMRNLAAQGNSIIMVSSELPELLGMSDRILVMCDGRMTGMIPKGKATQVEVMRLATQFMSGKGREQTC